MAGLEAFPLCLCFACRFLFCGEGVLSHRKPKVTSKGLICDQLCSSWCKDLLIRTCLLEAPWLSSGWATSTTKPWLVSPWAVHYHHGKGDIEALPPTGILSHQPGVQKSGHRELGVSCGRFYNFININSVMETAIVFQSLAYVSEKT